ncbi:RusA family crossover junction endodeoxyribonuclease [Candidatus Dojkabacteria bacterium]|jgi:Holliday junction resolvase RusA-like endonuclease|nr:RusA family crossover junction endodeoxyribonuclease [Candidatus Dojkabacteria bacterium]
MPVGVYDHHPELRKIHPPIKIRIDIEPVAKGRARSVFHGGKVHSYTPEKTKIYEDYLKTLFSQYKSDMFEPHIPLKLTVVFYRQKNKWCLRRETKPVRKPDCDNMIKGLLDCLSGTLCPDDASICTINASKRWSENGHGYIDLILEEEII